MKLIADAGSTKTAWALCMPGTPASIFTTRGCNALTATSQDMEELMLKSAKMAKVDVSDIDSVDYYGAGCATPAVCDKVAQVIKSVFPHARAYVASDLEGAAKALFPDSDGIACILGTGSNSCLWEDGKVTANVPPLGYILGDEGGGVALGKRLVADALRGMLPKEMCAELAKEYDVTLENVLENVYKTTAANTFLASTVPFLALHRDDPEIHHILIEEFSSFLERNVGLYNESKSYPLGFVGSVALHFREELQQVASAMGYVVTKIINGPIEALARNSVSRQAMKL